MREAHPIDGWQTPINEKEGIRLPMAKDMGQKEEHATACVRELDIKFPAVLDGMDNKIELEYCRWPARRSRRNWKPPSTKS